MNGSVAASIVTGTATLIGALGGVWLTQRHAARIAQAAQAESRRSLVRAELGTLLAEVRGLIDQAWVLIPAMSKMRMQEYDEFVNTDTGREMGRRRAAVNAGLINLSLMIKDVPVLKALAELQKCVEEWAEKATGPAFNAGTTGGDAVAAVESGFQHVERTRSALNALVVAAAPFVQISISDVQQRRSWPRPRMPWRARAAAGGGA
jgi:hypothetical protein